MFEKLTLKSVDIRAVLVPLRRPVVSKVGQFKEWPLILVGVLSALRLTDLFDLAGGGAADPAQGER